MPKKLGIDLGTANTLVFVPKKGVIINEPSVVAVSRDDNRILAVGNEAKEMLGRSPDFIVVTRPMRDGVIANYRVTEAMLRYFIRKASGPISFFKPEVIISVPAGITSTERRAVIEAAISAGAKAAYIVKEPLLAAIGAGLPVQNSSGHLVVNIGGGTSEVAVIALSGIVTWASVRVAGDKIDRAIVDYIKHSHNVAIGERTAEEVKILIGAAVESSENSVAEIRGRDLVDGLPKTIEVTTNDIVHAISDELHDILRTVKQVLAQTPPELSADILDKGMMLSGGGALLRGIGEFLSHGTGISATVAPEPLFCVAKGTGHVLNNLELYKRAVMTKR
ncbi:MAG: rod shape-determining protein [bacterium]|nr:rod shape-determining protein [bacterium]